jgi:hypothetical protein
VAPEVGAREFHAGQADHLIQHLGGRGQGVAEDFFSRGPVPEREKGHNGHAIQEVRVGNQFIERKPSAFSRMVDGFVGNG